MHPQTIIINHLQIQYFDEGQGKPILFLHGWLGSKEVFLPILKILKNHYRVIAPDLPGFGRSQAFSDLSNLQNQYLDFLHSFCQKLNLKNFYIFGNSYGGKFALLYSQKYSHQIQNIILYAPLIHCNHLPKIINNSFFFKFIKKTTQHHLFIQIYTKLIIFGFIRLMLIRKSKKYHLNHRQDILSIGQIFKDNINHHISKSIATSLIISGLKTNLYSLISTINLPLTIITSPKDKINSYRQFKNLQNIPNLKLETINSPGHSLLLANPINLSQLITQIFI